MSITFGTDGWRAVISDEFTFANVRHVAQAIAEILLENATTSNGQSADAPLAVVGFDTRFLSDRYAWAVSEVLAGNGLRGRAHAGRCTDPGRFLRDPAHASRGRRDDHGQPQPAALQRHQAQVGLRRQRQP